MARPRALDVVNNVLLPVKLIVPQPLIARVPGLTTNEDIRLERVLERVEGRLLDVGCGPNRLVRMYRERGGEGVGLDVHDWGDVDVLVERAAPLPFDDYSFDTVTFVACINHIPERVECLAECRRILRPGGSVVLTYLAPGPSRLWHRWAFWDADQHERGMKEGEVYGFTDREIEGLVTDAGFGDIRRDSASWGLLKILSARVGG